MKSLVQCITIAALSSLTTWLITKRNEIHKEPYMDEVFHVPQMQLYYHNNFSYWDPKITTFPGLYLTSYLISKLFHFFSPTGWQCDATSLRYLNVLFLCISFFFLHRLLRRTQNLSISCFSSSSFSLRACLYSLTIIFNPLSYFYCLFFYTDIHSTMTVILFLNHTWNRTLTRWYQISISLILAIAMVLARQTNVCWLLFVLGTRLITELCRDTIDDDKSKKLDNNKLKKNNKKNTDQWKRKDNNRQLIDSDLSIIMDLIRSDWRLLCKSVFKVIWYSADIVIVLVAFSAFVLINNGLVIGDRSAHQFSWHFVQIFYFLITLIALSPIRGIDFLTRFCRFTKTHPATTVLIIGSFVVIIYKFTVVHQYLLADNSVIRFYLWRRLLDRFNIKYFLAPLYWFSAFVFWNGIGSNDNDRTAIEARRDCLNRFNFLFCLFLALVPAPLFEFRYFIVPIMVWKILVFSGTFVQRRSTDRTWWWMVNLSVELTVCFVGNALIVWLFFYKPFYWPTEGGQLKRFMW